MIWKSTPAATREKSQLTFSFIELLKASIPRFLSNLFSSCLPFSFVLFFVFSVLCKSYLKCKARR